MSSRAALILALGVLAGCGRDQVTSVARIPNVAGTYTGYNVWLVQFVRTHDGFSGAFNCSGSVTVAETPQGQLSGFVVISAPCPPLTFDLLGSVNADGSVRFTTGSPRPGQGQCPPTYATTYTGLISDRVLAVRSTADVYCPGPGEGSHRFDYILTARLNP